MSAQQESSDRTEVWKQRVAPKVRTQTRLFLIIALVMFAVLIIRLIQGEISIFWAVVSLIAGGVVGRLAGRSSMLSWDQETSTVVSRMDLIGAIVLIAYLAFVFLKSRIVGHWIHDAHLVAAVGMGLTAGAMITRVLGTVHGVREILTDAGVIHAETP